MEQREPEWGGSRPRTGEWLPANTSAPAAPVPEQTTGRRGVVGAVVAAALAAGATGGAAGSLLTAAALNRSNFQPPAAAAAAAPAAPRRAAAPAAGSLNAIYRAVSPAVVSVQTAASGRLPAPGNRRPSPGLPSSPNGQDLPLLPRGEGSGFVVDGDGHVVTNYHVVDGATRVTVVLQDGTRVPGEVLGTDPGTDLALLKASLPVDKVAVAVLGDSDAIVPGDPAIAIGTPFGLDHSITAGIISAVDRDFGSAAGRPMRGLIQTDAPINPGNSGGPLLNAAGEVIGVTTAIESPVRGSVGIGFAIPINVVKRLLPLLAAGETVQHAWLGIAGVALTPELAADAGLPATVSQGILLAQVQPGSPAARAGLRAGAADESAAATPRGGDVVLAVDGRTVARVQDLAGYLDTKRPGDTVVLTVWRNGSRTDVRATLAPWPAPGP